MLGYWQLAVLYASMVSAFEVWPVYQAIYLYMNRRWIQRIRDLETRVYRLDPKQLEEVLGHGGSEGSMIQMGSIFIVASGVVLSIASQTFITGWAKIALAFSSPLLVGWWLFTVQLSTRLIMDGKMEVRLIQEHDPITRHIDNCTLRSGSAHLQRMVYGDRNGRGPIMWIRRNHWTFYLSLLIVAAGLIAGLT